MEGQPLYMAQSDPLEFIAGSEAKLWIGRGRFRNIKSWNVRACLGPTPPRGHRARRFGSVDLEQEPNTRQVFLDCLS